LTERLILSIQKYFFGCGCSCGYKFKNTLMKLEAVFFDCDGVISENEKYGHSP